MILRQEDNCQIDLGSKQFSYVFDLDSKQLYKLLKLGELFPFLKV